MGYLVYKMQHLKKKERVFEDYITCLKSFHRILPVVLFLETDICISEIYVRRYIYVNTYTNIGIPSQLFFLYKYLLDRKSFHAFGTPSKQ